MPNITHWPFKVGQFFLVRAAVMQPAEKQKKKERPQFFNFAKNKLFLVPCFTHALTNIHTTGICCVSV